jgi:hypothetical protein
MRQSTRAERRHHVQRLKHNRRNYWGYPNRYRVSPLDSPPLPPVEMDERSLGQVVHTPQLCSCYGCGNTRHNTGGWTPTIQELRWFEQYREQVEEAEDDLDERRANQATDQEL